MTDIRLLVLSDIHATEKDPNTHLSPSYVSTQGSGTRGLIEPISSMIATVKEAVGEVDYVICPGDMTDQSSPAGLTYIAQKLQDVTCQLKAKELVAVAGNHDVDSRFKHNQYDPRGHLMNTFPEMPFKGDLHHLEFFAHHLSMKDCGNIRFLAVDSAAFHGGGKQKKDDGSPEVPEYEHGRVSPIMLSRIRGLLEADRKRYDANLLVCHHHPANNNTVNEMDFSEMDGGPALIGLLDQGTYGRWMIIHGHKHRPRIQYATGGGTSPVLLGAASFSAQIGGDALNQSPNQFHLITIRPQLAAALGSGLAGSVESWSWIVGIGWRPAATSASGLPAYTGFGFRGDPDMLADQIDTTLGSNFTMRWEDLITYHPGLSALLPHNFDQLKAALQDKNINIAFDDRGLPQELGRSS